MLSAEKMATSVCNSPGVQKQRMAATQLIGRLHNCWAVDISWENYPAAIKEGCSQIGKAICFPPTAVLYGLMILISFSMSHAVVEVEGTDWAEPVLVWIAICMPTGSGKSSLCKLLTKLIEDTRLKVSGESSSPWLADDQSLEKLGALMSENHARLLGLYDELAMFFSQMNIFHGKSINDSRELSVFLQFFGAKSWSRRTVSGEANFEMKETGFTLGGFIQPSIARTMLEQHTSIEKGLCQRLLWCIPKPSVASFNELEKVNEQFSASIVCLLGSQWKDSSSVKKWILPKSYTVFAEKFDLIQEQLQSVSCMDELLSGMLSKAKGQILRVAATLHVLFHINTPMVIPDEISESAVKAAIDIVDVCIQQAVFLAGRGILEETIEELASSKDKASISENNGQSDAERCATTSLLLPGRVLDLKLLNQKRVFRNSGNKIGAVSGFEMLQENELGTIKTTKLNRGANMLYTFEKNPVPEEAAKKMTMIERLMKFGVSLAQYEKAFMMENMTMSAQEAGKKRASTEPSTPTRKSPRKKVT